MSDDLRLAAFGNRPDTPIPATHTSRDRWLAAVVLGGQGRYAAASALLSGLLRDPDPVIASLAASTLGSHRRQVGGHEVAKRLDAAALARLTGTGDGDRDGIDFLGARSDALLGLAADNLGTGRLVAARRLIDAADALGDVGWRGQVRLGWVRAEVELADSRPKVALPIAEAALRRARAARAARHIAKSEMILSATLASCGGVTERIRARQLAAGVVDWGIELDLLPLVWPCSLLLADLEPAKAEVHRRRAAGALHCVLRRADPIARRLAASSPWVPDTLLVQGEPTRTGIRANSFTELPPDRVKVGAQASDRGGGTSLGCRKESP
ncbi:hypothetical protein JOF56_002931 [Kibdelosporangium banguiense]|uniref:HEAT repeat domain-containing protein n=1 Tax=Kibdelosporangium banguiense TaxID=1365924 RepID=A0ABS4TDQ4_9PSEU|nr:hypothetical protein [Kibdelosporangium banguiense]MBP2322546.1 hypothetical protein [Kibdelosporangium banguiense]